MYFFNDFLILSQNREKCGLSFVIYAVFPKFHSSRS